MELLTNQKQKTVYLFFVINTRMDKEISKELKYLFGDDVILIAGMKAKLQEN